MELTRKRAAILKEAIQRWREDRIVSHEEAEKLLGSFEVVPFDWRRLAKYSFWVAIFCIAISVQAVFADKLLWELIRKLFSAPYAVICAALGAAAAAFYRWGAVRRKRNPEKYYSNEATFFLGVLATAGSIFYFGKVIDTGSGYFSILLLVSFFVYGLLGFFLDSRLIWVFSILSLGGWFGAETGYWSGWGAYYLRMNYPLRFVLFGSVLTAASYGLLTRERFAPFHKSTLVLGLLYLFIALWILSIVGNYGDRHSWQGVRSIELFHWSLLFGLVAGGAIFLGLKNDDNISRGFGLTFLFINLYTRFFEYFWKVTHKAVFFAILAVSFWWLGTRAEKIWRLGSNKGD